MEYPVNLRLSVREVESRTQDNVKYAVRLVNSLPVSCTCPDWRYRVLKNNLHVCYHMTTAYMLETEG